MGDPTDADRAAAREWLDAELSDHYGANLDSLAALLARTRAEGAAEAIEAAVRVVEQAAIQTGYGFFRSDNPHEFRPDPDCTTNQERENHRLACEAYDRGEPIPDQSFTPDATTFVDGVIVHQTGGPWGIGTYTFKDDALSDALCAIRALAPAGLVAVDPADLEMVLPLAEGGPADYQQPSAWRDAHRRLRAAVARKEPR